MVEEVCGGHVIGMSLSNSTAPQARASRSRSQFGASTATQASSFQVVLTLDSTSQGHVKLTMLIDVRIKHKVEVLAEARTGAKVKPTSKHR